MAGHIRKNPFLLSVVICTHSRLPDLINALDSLKDQVIGRNDVELIIIDNHSQDGTAVFLADFCQNTPNIRSIFEPNIGLSNARNRGWKEAHGLYIGYTDDDALLPSSWISEAVDIIIQEKFPLFGGPYYPYYQKEKPDWFKDDYGSSYWLPEKESFLTDRYLVGGNMFIRRDILEAAGGFSPQYGMSGGKLGYNEETNFQINLLKTEQEIKIFFTPRLFIHHLVADQKMDPFFPFKRYYKQGSDKYRFEKADFEKSKFFKKVFNLVKIPFIFCAGTIDLVLLLLVRNRKKYPHWQNYIYERSKRYAYEMGYAVSVLLGKE